MLAFHAAKLFPFILMLEGDTPLAESHRGYLLTPTPGATNVFVDSLTGPLISGVSENPGALLVDHDLTVTASVRDHNAPVGVVRLQYRVMFDDEVSVTMVEGADDRTLQRLGLNPDGALYKMTPMATASSTNKTPC